MAVIMPTRGHHSDPSQTANSRTTLHKGDDHRATIVEGYGVRRENPSNTFHPRSPSVITRRMKASNDPEGVKDVKSILLYVKVLVGGRAS